MRSWWAVRCGSGHIGRSAHGLIVVTVWEWTATVVSASTTTTYAKNPIVKVEQSKTKRAEMVAVRGRAGQGCELRLLRGGARLPSPSSIILGFSHEKVPEICSQ